LAVSLPLFSDLPSVSETDFATGLAGVFAETLAADVAAGFSAAFAPLVVAAAAAATFSLFGVVFATLASVGG
jgi:hypothetical protein